MARQRLIRASEIGEYVYCQRAWWLHQVQGVAPTGRERREQGTRLHVQHGSRVQLSQILIVGSVMLGLLAIILIALQ